MQEDAQPKNKKIYLAILAFLAGLLSRKAIVFILVFILGIGVSNLLATAWPTFRGTPKRTGVSEEAITIPLALKWSFQTGGPIEYSSVVVVGDLAYVGSDDGKLYAIDVSTGIESWSYDTGYSILSTPTVEGDKIYFGSGGGKFYAFNATSGAFVWEFDVEGGEGNPVNSSPVTDGTNIYFGCNNGKIYALTLDTGAEVWASPFQAGSQLSYPAAALVTSDGVLYIGAEDGVVYAINTSDGSEKWNYPTADNCFSTASPAVVGNVVFVGSDNGIVYGINRNTGALILSEQLSDDILASPAIVGTAASGTLYIGDISGNFYSYNLETKTLNWTHALGTCIVSSATYANDLLFLGADAFYVFNASNGNLKWSYNTGFIAISSTAIADGVVYIASVDGKVYAFEPTTVQAAFVKKWVYDINSPVIHSAVVTDSNGNSYVGAEDGALYSVDSAGVFRWKYQGVGRVCSTPIVDNPDGIVFFSTDDGKVYAVNTADGTLKWNKNLPSDSGIITSAAVVKPAVGRIYAGTTNGKAYALNIADGSVAYSYDTGCGYSCNISSVVFSGSTGYFTYGSHGLVALNASFEKLWEKTVPGWLYSHEPVTIALDSGVIFVGGVDGVYAVNVSDHTLKWEYPTWGAATQIMAANGTVFAASRDHNLYAINASDGTLEWKYNTGTQPSLPVPWEDVLFVASDRQVLVICAEDGQLRSSYTRNLAPLSPVITDSLLKVATRGGKIFCVDINSYTMDVVASLGGTLSTVYGDFLEIPVDALSGDTTITLEISENTETPPAGTVALPRKYDYAPHGTNFSPSALAKFAYKDSDLQGEPEEDIRVFVWDNVANVWTSYSGTLDTINKKFEISLAHFSEFMMVAGMPKEFNAPVFGNQYQLGDKIIINYSPTDPNTIRWIHVSLNHRRVKSGKEVTLDRDGENVFRILAMTFDQEKIRYTDSFEVVGVSGEPTETTQKEKTDQEIIKLMEKERQEN